VSHTWRNSGWKRRRPGHILGPFLLFCEFLRGPCGIHAIPWDFRPQVLESGTSLNGGWARQAHQRRRCAVRRSPGSVPRIFHEWRRRPVRTQPVLGEQRPDSPGQACAREINGNWTRAFNAAYAGEYDLKSRRKVAKNASRPGPLRIMTIRIPLSCHEVDVANVPDEYDPEFVDYVIMSRQGGGHEVMREYNKINYIYV
jgi:hypothetical protein